MIETIAFLLIHGTENRHDLVPFERQLGVEFVLEFNFQSHGGSTEICFLTAEKGHGFHGSRVGFGHTVTDLLVALTVAEPLGDDFLIPCIQQTAFAGQHILQIRVSNIQLRRKKLGNAAVAVVLLQQPFKLCLAFRTEDGIGQRRVAELHIVVPNFGDLKEGVIQIDGIAHLVGSFGICCRRGFGNRFRLFCRNHLFRRNNDDVALIHVPLKVGSLHADSFLLRYAWHGVPNIILVHTVNDHGNLGVSIKGCKQMIAGVVGVSVWRGENHSFRDALGALDSGKIVNGVCLFRKAQQLATLTVILLDGIIPNTGNAALIRQQTDGIAVRGIHCLFLCGDLLHIIHHLTDERVIIELFGVNYFAVYNAALGKVFTDGNGVNIVQTVILRFGIELILFDKLCDTPLYLCPRQYRRLRIANGDLQRQGCISHAIFLCQPCGGVLFPSMLFHIAHNGAFAFDIAVPFLQGRVNICLCDFIRGRCHRSCQRGIGFFQKLLMQTVMEGRHIKVELCELEITGFCDNSLDSGCSLDICVFPVRVAAGVDIGGICNQRIANRQFVLFKQFLYGRFCLFGFADILHRLPADGGK